jgi:glutaminyl-peptide cyclotransferase
MKKRALRIVSLLLLLLSQAPSAPVAGYKLIHTYPHDPDAFTQGLLYYDGDLYEGTGMNGQSSVRRVQLSTGQVLQKVDLPYDYFGEGITLWKDKLIEMTWQSKIGFVYDRATLKQLHTFTYNREGWGITQDGKRLIMSDGSSTLYFWDPETFREIGHLDVDDQGRPVPDLNELEYVRGEIYANVWHTDRIARISPSTGHVLGWINLAGLWSGSDDARKTLNGIAYDAKQNRLFVTGKLWPNIFEIQVTPTTTQARQRSAKVR